MASTGDVSTSIAQICSDLLTDGECFIHKHPDQIADIAALWVSYERTADATVGEAAEVLDDNLKCAECLLVYYDYKDELRISSRPFHQELWSKLNARDIKRQRKVFLNLADHSESSNTLEAHHKNLFLISASEILRRPEPLADAQVDDLFVRVLLSIQRIKPLKFKAGVLPGLVLLTIHKNNEVREWACRCICSSYAKFPTGADELFQIKDFFVIMADIIFGRIKSSTYNFTTDICDVWDGFSIVIESLNDEGMENLLRLFPRIDGKIFEKIVVSSGKVFWRALQCFSKLSSQQNCWIKSSFHASKALNGIVHHKEFMNLATQENLTIRRGTDDTADDLSENVTEFCFKWILIALESLDNTKERSSFFESFKNYSAGLCAEAREVFMNDVTLPLINQIESPSEDQAYFEAVVILHVSVCCSLQNPDFAAVSKVLGLIENDIGILETCYETFFNEKGKNSPNPGILYKLWAYLGSSPLQLPESLASGILSKFSRIYLLDYISLNDISPDKIPFNLALRSVVKVIVCILKSGVFFDFCELRSVLLYCISSPHAEISESSRDVLFRTTSTTSLSSMLSHLLFIDDDFWTVYYALLDSFRDYCGLGPPLLKSAIRILDVLLGMFTDIFADTNQDFEKETVWLKVWPFITAVLSSSVNWAKQDLKLKPSITQTIETTLKLSALVMNHFSTIFPSPKFLMSVAAPFSNAISAGMMWFKVHSESLRNQTVSVITMMMDTAISFSMRLNPSVVDALSSYASGVVKSHISSSQKHSFELLLQKYKSSVSSRISLSREKSKGSFLEVDNMTSSTAPVKDSWHNEKLKTLFEKSVPKPASSISAVKKESSFFRKEETPSAFVPKKPDPPKSFMPEKPPAIPVPKNVPEPAISFPKRNLPLFKPKIPLPKKPVAKKGKAGTLMAQLRQEHYTEMRRNNVIKKGSTARAVSPDEEHVSLKVISADVSPDRPKRQTIFLDERKNVVDVSRKKRPTGVPLRKEDKATFRSLDDLRKIVLGWDFNGTGELPPAFKRVLRKIPLQFTSVEEYIDLFEPFAILEAWESFKTAKEETDFSQKCIMVVASATQVDDFFDVSLTFPTEQHRKFRFSENDVIHLEPETSKPNFTALLGEARSFSVKREETTATIRLFMKGRKQHQHLFHAQSRWNVVKLFSLTTTVREYRALISLKDLELKDSIMNPPSRDMDVEVNEESVRRVMNSFGLNEPQAMAIAKAKEQSSGFVLIQGPPGTGKTKTIVGLVGILLTTMAKTITVPGGAVPSKKKERLLICAPSNAACDEILKRLRSGAKDVKGEVFAPKIVRLGTPDSVSEEAKESCLDNLVTKALKEDPSYSRLITDNKSAEWDALLENQKSLKKERDGLRKKEAEMQDEPAEVLAIGKKIREITGKLKETDVKIKDIKSSRSERSANMEKIKSKLRIKFVQDADLVISTLSGAGHDLLLTKCEVDFPTVIIDEAGQAVELSALIPLKYKAKKCVLVGDPKQLPPTILSPTSIRYGYEQSLFQRLMTASSDRVALLSIQYRMHPEISSFPSFQFYESRLLDAEKNEQSCTAPWHKDASFPPYSFYDVEWGREQRAQGHSLHNPDEVMVCFNLVCMLCSKYPDLRFRSKIGIITPYKLQMIKLRDKFKRAFGESILKAIDINTVDAFQGQEKDIIIVSTVRAGLGRAIGFLKDRRRMNVALTRAKKSVFVIGRSTSLCNNEDWRALVENAQSRDLFIEAKRDVWGRELDIIPTNLLA